MTRALYCQNLTKSYNNTPVLQGVNLTANEGEFVTLLGPSGCGKTTTLRLLAGFEPPDAGTITIHGRMVADGSQSVPAEDRRVGMVFQEYALFPHISVAENIAFGLNGSKDAKARRVAEMLDLVGMAEFGQRMPHALSGGQQQRVALARALAPEPHILLLDEPFSNLDAALRAQVRGQLRDILRQTGITAVFVTHDQQEALSLSDRVAVIFDGRVVQMDTPPQLYTRPVSQQVATFIGEANLIPAEATGNSARCVLGVVRLYRPAQGAVNLLIRPETVQLGDTGVPAEVLWQEFYGHDQRVGVQLDDGTQLVARIPGENTYTPGDRIKVSGPKLVQAL